MLPFQPPLIEDKQPSKDASSHLDQGRKRGHTVVAGQVQECCAAGEGITIIGSLVVRVATKNAPQKIPSLNVLIDPCSV